MWIPIIALLAGYGIGYELHESGMSRVIVDGLNSRHEQALDELRRRQGSNTRKWDGVPSRELWKGLE